MGSFSIWHWLVVLVIVALIFGTKKLRNIGSDLGGAVKGFKEGMKDANGGDKPAEPIAQQRVSGETIDVQAKEKSTLSPRGFPSAAPSPARPAFFPSGHRMFDVSLTELMVIGVVALIVIGPERLPKVARTVGHLLGRAQRYVNDVKSDIQREIELDELRKFKSEMETAAQGVQKSLHETQASLEEPVQQLRAELDEAAREVNGQPAAQRPPPTRPRRCPRRRLPQVRLPQVRLPQDRLPLSPPPNPRAPSRRPRRTPIWPWTSAPSRHRPQRPPRRRPANPRPPPSPPRPGTPT